MRGESFGNCTGRPNPDIVNLTESIYKTAELFPDSTQFSLAIIESGEVTFFGVKKTNGSVQKVDNHRRIFEIGSVTKVFTSTLLSNFVVKGKLDLNESINTIIENISDVNGVITFKDLASHTSGLPRLPSNLDLLSADAGNPYKDYNDKKLMEYLTNELYVSRTPGTGYEYSNLGAGLLGYILSEFSDSSYEALLEEFVFSRYDMKSSSTERNVISGGLVKGIDALGKETANWDFNVLVGAGGILSSVEDLSKFALAQFNEDNIELQLTQQATFKVSETMKVGLGWHILHSDTGNEILWHTGGTGGYSSSIALDKENKNGIIILSNVSAFHNNTAEIDKLCIGLLNKLK